MRTSPPAQAQSRTRRAEASQRMPSVIASFRVLFVSLIIGFLSAGHAQGHDPSRHGPAAPATTSSGPAVTVELQAKVQGDLPWRFWPDRRVIRARRGESVQVLYRARNLGERQITGKAIHSIMPDGAEEHLSLIECFCFVQATLEPGEERVFPLVFQLRPTLPRTVRRVVIRYEFAAEPSGGPVAGPAVPPSSGTLEVWAKARRAEGSEGNPVGLRAVSVGIEGQASPGVAGWFQLPALAHGVPLDGDGRARRLLQSAVPAGTYRALRLQVAASRGTAKEAPTALLLHSAPVPIAFTILSGETTILVLDVALRAAGGPVDEVSIERAIPRSRPPHPTPLP